MDEQPLEVNGAFSTIDPRIQLYWDSTSINALKRCPEYYNRYMLQNWKSDRPATPLTFGILFHRMLEIYDRIRAEGGSFEEGLRYAIKTALLESGTREPDGAWKPWVTEDPKRNLDSLLRSAVWYLDFFRNDPAKTIILHNNQPAVELSFRFMLEEKAPTGENYWFTGHIDRLVEFNNQVWVMDRKTTTRGLGGGYFDSYTPDNQMSLYTLASKIVYGTEAQGVIIDAVEIGTTQSKFQRGFVYRTPQQLEEWYQDTLFWIKLAGQFALQNRWPMNDASCGNYGKCLYRDICSQSPHMREAYLKAGFHKEIWDPTKARGED